MGRFSLIRRKPAPFRPFDPAAAPHLALVRERLEEVLPLLHRRLRQGHLDELARRVVAHEQSPEPLVELARGDQLALLVRRIAAVAIELEGEERLATRAFADLSYLHSQVDDERDKRRLMAEYLREAATDRKRLRGDLAALDRDLGLDAVRERNASEILRVSSLLELGLLFVAGAVPIATADPARAGAVVAELEADGLVELIDRRVVDAGRWQVRYAASQAVLALVVARAAQPALAAEPPALAGSLGAAQNRDEHPWLQAVAIESLLVGDPGRGRDLVVDRILTRSDAGGRDFLVRKLVLQACARRLPAEQAERMFTLVLGSRDPSEHVRMGLCRTAPVLGLEVALRLLPALAGLDPAIPEPSHKVRATACIVARELIARAGEAERPTVIRAVADLLAGVAERDDHSFVLEVAGDELGALAHELAEHGPAELLAERAPTWRDAMVRVSVGAATPPRAAEAAAAAAEVIEREQEPGRRLLTRALADALAATPSGRRGALVLAALPAAAREVARDRGKLLRVLADLTRRGWGASAHVTDERLVFWRGDRFRRRIWRVIHELRNPIPNKRQAWVHTVGRTYPGELRAHPGLLDEATATTVPGERVQVDSEGTWCRHLPMVDDVLDLPILRDHPVMVGSSHGAVTITPPATVGRRLLARARVSWHYRRLANLRLAALAAVEPRERRRYVETLERELGVKVEFTPHHAGELVGGEVITTAPGVANLFPVAEPEPAAPAGAPVGASLALFGSSGWLRDFWDAHGGYFLSARQNSQAALATFGAGIAAIFIGRAFQKRRQIEKARDAVPLTIGGWGTRGKSGTERLKAGLFDGMGFEVFVKTTGCEAMFIHSAPLQAPVEIFIYRPYDKATIWEQRDMIRLASRLHAEVFLWECMALNPKYVQLLQHDWMNDDLVTLTNCYPDHEDIQGPAGYNVAQVITEFIPTRSTLVTSETSYLPMFEDTAKRRGTTMYSVGEREAELIADELLDLFPYREHPRNIALVSRVAEELGLERDFSQVMMAANVVPDLGVLKAYPRARVRGRYLTFVCGNSANERTGFINNWRRMRLDRLDLEADPHKLVVTVVNNRADRISRSEVFARILVRDVAFDRHVLIGTNLKGLRGFLNTALGEYLVEVQLIQDDEITGGGSPALPLERLGRELGNLRIPPATPASLLIRLALYARPAGLEISAEGRAELTAELGRRLAVEPAGSVSFAELRRGLVDDRALAELLERALVPLAEPEPTDAWPETLDPPTRADVIEHALFELARLVLRGRLEAQIRALFERPSPAELVALRARFAEAYREMFLAQVDVIEDAGASGDQIIDRCARVVPPGSEVTLMGTQNIKGTGLDFVYRWLALDKVVTCLADLASPRLDRRSAGLIELEAFEDHGLFDTGLLRVMLAREPAFRPSVDAEAALARIRTKVDEIYARRKKALVEQRKATRFEKAVGVVEGTFDYIDSTRRTRRAQQIIDDLVNQRISHGRASLEMRKLVARIKGGWLLKAIRGKK